MPAVRLFLDANVLLYTLERSLAAKAEIARRWLQEASSRDAACANLQVMNETVSVLLRKRLDLSAYEIFTAVDSLAFLGKQALDEGTVRRARQVRLATRYQWWDCLLLASAADLACSHFLSEDLQDGRVVDGVRIVDPFAHDPDELFPPG